MTKPNTATPTRMEAIAEAYHNDGISAETSTDKPPERRKTGAARDILESPQKLDAMMGWWPSPESGSPATDSESRIKIDKAILAAIGELYENGGRFFEADSDELADSVSKSPNPLWINMYNTLLPIAELYHTFTNEKNAALMDTPTTEKESPNTEAVEASESKTTTTYICGRCDTEHTSMTSAAMCCPDVNVMHTCNECGLHHDTRAAADYCCSSIETKHKHPDDPVLMLYACRTCGTIPFNGAKRNEQKWAADQHCNPMIEK